MERTIFKPAAGQISRERKTIVVGDIVGVVSYNAQQGYIGIVDHIYKNNNNLTYFIIRYVDGSSANISSARFYDVEETNRMLLSNMDDNSKALEELKK